MFIKLLWSCGAGDPTSPRIRELRSLRSTGALRKCLKESLLNSGNISDRKDAIISTNVISKSSYAAQAPEGKGGLGA